jgi:hypothetical protein
MPERDGQPDEGDHCCDDPEHDTHGTRVPRNGLGAPQVRPPASLAAFPRTSA